MSRKRRGLPVRPRGQKGRPTPKNTPGSTTRQQHSEWQARKANAILRGTGIDRILETIRATDRGEQKALELLQRESGGVLLDPKENR